MTCGKGNSCGCMPPDEGTHGSVRAVQEFSGPIDSPSLNRWPRRSMTSPLSSESEPSHFVGSLSLMPNSMLTARSGSSWAEATAKRDSVEMMRARRVTGASIISHAIPTIGRSGRLLQVNSRFGSAIVGWARPRSSSCITSGRTVPAPGCLSAGSANAVANPIPRRDTPPARAHGHLRSIAGRLLVPGGLPAVAIGGG